MLKLPDFLGGIPASIFRPGTAGLYETASGRLIKYRFEIGYICLRAADMRGIQFVAGYNFHEGRAIMGLDVCTKWPDGSRHPDFRSVPLVDAAVAYFNEHNRKPLEMIEGKWGPNSDNWHQYVANLALFGPEPTAEQKFAAANGTWSGRTANPNGFYANSVSSFGGGHSAEFVLGAIDYPMPKL